MTGPRSARRGGRGRKAQKASTRAQLLECARGMFAQRGFQASTIRAIAAEAGVASGTVIAHFPDKASLLVAAMLDDLTAAQQEAFSTLPRRSTVEKQLLHLARVFYTYYARDPGLSRTLLKEMWFVPGEWGHALTAGAAEFSQRVAALLAAAKDRGELRRDTDCAVAATAFFSQYLTVLLGGLSFGEFRPDEAVATLGQLWRQHLVGIGAPQPRARSRR